MDRGQLVSIEVIVAFLIFLSIFTIFQLFLNSFYRQSSQNLDEKAYLLAFQTSQILSTSSGYPENWNSTNLTYIGLARSRNVLDERKTRIFFTELNYNSTISLYLPIGSFDAFILLRNASNNEIVVIDGKNATFGLQPNSTKVFSVNVRTPVFYAENECFLDVVLWREK